MAAALAGGGAGEGGGPGVGQGGGGQGGGGTKGKAKGKPGKAGGEVSKQEAAPSHAPSKERSKALKAEQDLERMRLELEERKVAMAKAQREVDIQLEAAKAALAGKERAQAEFDEVNELKLAQGAVVDGSGVDLKAAMVSEEHARREAELQVQGAVDEQRERGNRAMRAGDPIAARGFYGEALALSEGQTLPDGEVAKLHANRCAALLAMDRPQEALADARRATELAPRWSKACYRLGGVLQKLGRLAAAAAALRRAVALAAEAGGEGGEGGEAARAEIGARLEGVACELAAQIEARAQRKAAAGAAAASGDWEGACGEARASSRRRARW